MERVHKLGNIYYEKCGGNFAGNVYGTEGIAPTLLYTMSGGGSREPMIPENDYEYRIRKITPKEAWRIMNFADRDFEAAASVNSNTHLYSQAGNSICRNVLIAIFGQMIPGKENIYKEINNRGDTDVCE